MWHPPTRAPRPSPSRGPRPRRRPTSARPSVEVLEVRDLPSGFTLGPLATVSGPSPFDGSPYQPEFGRDAETENWVAVDPTDPRHAVAAWFQDLAIGIVAAATFDGGATWRSAVVPGLTLASGGAFPTASDPWVTFAADGGVYVSSVQNHFFEHGHGSNAVRVSKSTDGGLTWGAPTTLIEEHDSGFLNDKPSITADPRRADVAYAVWMRNQSDQHPVRDETMFARTTDGGRTWEPARAVAVAGDDDSLVAHQVLVEPDGALVILVEEDVRQGNATTSFVAALRSTDGGATWSGPVLGPPMLLPAAVIDPETGQGIGEGNADFAADPRTGALYAVWDDTRFSGGQVSGIAFSESADGGRTWTAPVKVNRTPTAVAPGNQQAFLPSVAVADDGTVGVTYYDLRNNTPSPGLPTDYWFVHATPSADLTDPGSWGDELRLTDASFDMEAAAFVPVKEGFFLGDYEGLASAGDDFVPTWCMPRGTDVADIVSRRIVATAEHASGGAAAIPSSRVAASLPPATSPPGGSTAATPNVTLAPRASNRGPAPAAIGRRNPPAWAPRPEKGPPDGLEVIVGHSDFLNRSRNRSSYSRYAPRRSSSRLSS